MTLSPVKGYNLYHEANRPLTKSCQWNVLCNEVGCFIPLNPEIFSDYEVFEIEYIPLIFHLYEKIDFLCNKDDTLQLNYTIYEQLMS